MQTAFHTFAALVVATFFTFIPSLLFAQEYADTKEAREKALTQESLPDVSISPVVVNEKAKPRDIIKKELIVTNNTDQRKDLYIAVENVDPEKGAEEFVEPATSDLSTSLANWVEITRGVVELGPHESRKIPYLIHVNLTAKPNTYFAHIAFFEGANRSEAQARGPVATLLLGVEVLDNAKERLQLGTFTANDTVVFGDTVDFSYLLENVGNRTLEPRGTIRIFNRRGEEVGSVPLNADGIEITPENKRQLATAWNADGRFGKYKAYLDMEYGENQVASVQDTVYFWVFPWKEIFATIIGVLVLAFIGTFVVHMRAMARPTPVSYTPPETSAPLVSHTPTPRPLAPTQAPRTSSTSHKSTSQRGAVVALASSSVPRKRTAAQLHHTITPSTNRGTIALKPRSGARTLTHGNTVELTSRK